MQYHIVPTPKFKKQAKKLIKKFVSLRSELEKFHKSLLKEPTQGTNFGNNTYKVRLAVKSKG